MTDKEALKLALDWYDSGAEHRDEFQVMIESILVQRKPLTHEQALAAPVQPSSIAVDAEGENLAVAEYAKLQTGDDEPIGCIARRGR